MAVFMILLILGALVFSLIAFNLERNKAVSDQRFNAYIEEKKKSLIEIKRQGKIMNEQRSQTNKLREEAKFLEDENNYDYAILAYLQEIEKAQGFNFDFHHYKESIHRVVILYGKMKNYIELQKYLEFLIEKYPERKEVTGWKNRLDKILIINARNA